MPEKATTEKTQETKQEAKKGNIFENLFSPKIKSKKNISTQRFLNIKGIKDGIIILKNGGLRSILLASSINFALMSEDEQKGKVFAFQDFLNSLEFPLQIVTQTRKLNIAQYVEKIKEMERVQENELLRMQIGGYGEYILSLVELASITSSSFYAVVPYSPSAMKGESSGPLSKIKNFWQPTKEIKAEIEAFDKSKGELSMRISHVVGGLSGMGIRSAVLDTQEVVELLYGWYNPEVSSNEILADLKELKVERGE